MKTLNEQIAWMQGIVHGYTHMTNKEGTELQAQLAASTLESLRRLQQIETSMQGISK